MKIVNEDYLDVNFKTTDLFKNDLTLEDSASKALLFYSNAKCDTKGLVNLLNGINNQGITDINLPDVYKKDGKLLPLTNMSSAESLFTVSYLAVTLNRRLYIKDNLMSLSNKTKQYYLSTFNMLDIEDNIVLVTDDFYCDIFIDMLEGGVS